MKSVLLWSPTYCGFILTAIIACMQAFASFPPHTLEQSGRLGTAATHCSVITITPEYFLLSACVAHMSLSNFTYSRIFTLSSSSHSAYRRDHPIAAANAHSSFFFFKEQHSPAFSRICKRPISILGISLIPWVVPKNSTSLAISNYMDPEDHPMIHPGISFPTSELGILPSKLRIPPGRPRILLGGLEIPPADLGLPLARSHLRSP